MTNLNRFAQLYKQRIIFIFETPLEMKDLSNYFDPSTVWIDVTNMKDVEVGYVQGVDSFGNFVLKSPANKIQEENLSTNEIYYKIYFNIKLQREKYINKILRQKAYLDINEPFRYINDNSPYSNEYRAVAKKITDYLVETNVQIEDYIKSNTFSNKDILKYLNKEFKDVIKEIGLEEFKI